jgi:hypothetical protein
MSKPLLLLAVGLAGTLACSGSTETVPASTGATAGGTGGTGVGGFATTGCPGDLLECGGACVDSAHDIANCGACGTTCAPDQLCDLGACKCPAAFTQCGAQCVDTQYAPVHCGACDVTCDIAAGETCVAGACTGGCAPGACDGFILAQDQGNAVGIEADGSFVYWTHSSGGVAGVSRVPVGGGVVVELASGETSPTHIAIDATHVYFTDYNADTVKRVPKTGGPVTLVAQDPLTPFDVTSDGVHAYYTTETAVQKVPVGGGSIETLVASLDYAMGIAADATDVFFTTQTTVQRISKNGGAPTVLAAGLTGPRSVALSGDAIYFVSYDDCAVHAVPKAGGSMVLIGAGDATGGCGGIAVDAVHAYVVGFEVVRWPLAAGAAELLSPIGGFDLALDTSHVFIAGSPLVMQVPK